MPEMKGGSDTGLGSLSMQLRHICLEYPYAQLEASTNGFDESRRLGSGTAGTVYHGEMPDGSDVAVKVIDMELLGDDSMVAGFEEEIAVLSKFRHPNLVVLMGWAREGSRRFLIYEFLSGGDVFQRLAKCRMDIAPFPWHERLAICRHAATGLAHLHNAIPHAFHRDIKSANILLGGGAAKMADFGLSCVAKSRQASDMQCKYPSGTPGYTCPTYIRTGKVTEGSEVYSFGTVMLEIVTNLMPAGLVNGTTVYPINEALRPREPDAIERCLEYADAKAGWPEGVSSDIAQLALSCIHPDDKQRPRFTEVCLALKAIQERYPATPIPANFSPVYETQTPASNSGNPSAILLQEQQAEKKIGFALPANVANSTLPPNSDAPRQNDCRRLSEDRITRLQGSSNVPARTPLGGSRQGSPQVDHRPTAGEDESFSPPKRAVAQARAVVAKAGARKIPGGTGEAWPSGADVALQVGFVYGKDLSSLPQHVQLPPITPTIDVDGRRIIQIGRHPQQQWFEALLEDPLHRNSVSRVSFDISWGGNSVDPAPLLHTRGNNLLVVDDVVVSKDQFASLRPGSQIRIMFQLSDEQDKDGHRLADLLMLVVDAVPHVGASVGNSEGPLASDLPLPPLAPKDMRREGARDSGSAIPADTEEMWRLELVFAVGLSPEALMGLPVSLRTFCFVLTVDRPAVTLGRGRQMPMFEAILQGQKDLMAVVSREHLELRLVGGGNLQVTNLSQNVSFAASHMLVRCQDSLIRSGDTISFAAQAEMVPGGDKMPIIMRGGEEKELAPFLTFRAVKIGSPSPRAGS